MNALPRPYAVRPVSMAQPQNPPGLYQARDVNNPHNVPHNVHPQDNRSHRVEHPGQAIPFRHPMPAKERVQHDHKIERHSVSVPLDPMYIKVLRKIFPQLSTEAIGRELQLCYNDLTKTVEVMLMRYHSALEGVPFHTAAVQPSVATEHYGKPNYLHAPPSPKSYSRESSPSSNASAYSPGPPQLYTPVVYPSDAKYEYTNQMSRSHNRDIEHRVYTHENDFQHEVNHGFDRRNRDESRRIDNPPPQNEEEWQYLHRRQHSPKQNGVLSYEEARQISARQNKENAHSTSHHNIINGQDVVKVKQENELEVEDLIVSSSVGQSAKEQHIDSNK